MSRFLHEWVGVQYRYGTGTALMVNKRDNKGFELHWYGTSTALVRIVV
ncbi:MAG: hypothetical protein ACRDHW_09785 [Ktedonobacteraceae bacterium]